MAIAPAFIQEFAALKNATSGSTLKPFSTNSSWYSALNPNEWLEKNTACKALAPGLIAQGGLGLKA
jgi:hypothetical protein